ncbi:MAG TPA: zinc ribbon domain-containing protein [Terriglobales bacterium]|nr:zinc ribbon domain-containing protein [Terriglobales bacterium]
MAFCTNCGKALGDGSRFCTNCGTAAQITAPAPVVIPGSNAAVAPAPALVGEPVIPADETIDVQPEVASAPPVPKSETSSFEPHEAFSTAAESSTSPVFLIICIVLLLLIVGGIAGTVYFQRQGKAKTAAQQVGPETSPSNGKPSSDSSTAGSNSASASSTAATTATTEPTPQVSTPATSAPVADSIRVMNLGNYPGATPVAIATLTGETVVAGFLTRDTPQQVMQFYKIRFPVSATTESEGKTELSATLPGGERIRIQAQPQGVNTQVMVLQEK